MKLVDEKSASEGKEIDEKIIAALQYQETHFPKENKFDFYKHLPSGFKFKREDVCYPVRFTIEENSENMAYILLNTATKHLPLFRFIVENTPPSILDEAINHQELGGCNTLFFIFTTENKAEAYHLTEILLNNVNEEAFDRAMMTPYLGAVYPIIDALNKFELLQLIIDTISSARLENWLKTNIFYNMDLLVGIINTKNISIIRSVLMKAGQKFINQQFSHAHISLLLKDHKQNHQEVIGIIGKALYPETVEKIILGENLLSTIRYFCGPKKRFIQTTPTDLKHTPNPNIHAFLDLLSDQLLLKCVTQMQDSIITQGSNKKSLLEISAIYNPALFNAMLCRLGKVEGWKYLYNRLKDSSICKRSVIYTAS